MNMPSDTVLVISTATIPQQLSGSPGAMAVTQHSTVQEMLLRGQYRSGEGRSIREGFLEVGGWGEHEQEERLSRRLCFLFKRGR